jgi:hypothetical protein
MQVILIDLINLIALINILINLPPRQHGAYANYFSLIQPGDYAD